MDDGLRALFGTLSASVPLIWAAIAFLCKFVFALPSSKRVDDLENKLNRLERQVTEDRITAARRFGLIYRGKASNDDEDET